jgi:hypothetical protein
MKDSSRSLSRPLPGVEMATRDTFPEPCIRQGPSPGTSYFLMHRLLETEKFNYLKRIACKGRLSRYKHSFKLYSDRLGQVP